MTQQTSTAGAGPDAQANRPMLGARLWARCNNVIHRVRRTWLKRAFPLILADNPPEASENWAIFCYNDAAVQRNAGAALAARDLMLAGWHVKFPYLGLWWDGLADPNNAISGGLRRGSSLRHCSLIMPPENPIEWVVDWKLRRAEALGMNFFDVIQNTVDNLRKFYGSDPCDPSAELIFNDILKTTQAVLEVARRIERAADNGKRISLLMNEEETAPNAVFGQYFTQPARRHKVAVHHLCESYHVYTASGQTSLAASRTGAAVLMTRAISPDVPDNYYTSAEEFEPWFQSLSTADHQRIMDAVMPMIRTTGIRSVIGHAFDNDISRKIRAFRETGKPVYCLFAHVAYDRPIRDSTGAFTGMDDWIRKTTELFREIDGLLLIKPHLWEMGLEGTPHKPTVTIGDMLGDRLPENVLLLPANQFLAHEVAALIDAALIWRSSAYVEMVLAELPTLFCGPVSFYKPALRLKTPSKIKAYEESLRTLPDAHPSEDLRRRAAAILFLLNHERVIPLDIIKQLPDRICEGNLIIQPLKLLKLRLTNRHSAHSLAKAVQANSLGAYRDDTRVAKS